MTKHFGMKLAAWIAGLGLLTLGPAFAQTGAIEGVVKGADGKGLQNAMIYIERTDIKGNYKVKTNKKGEFFHAGLPLGNYTVKCEVNGQIVDQVGNVRTRLGDPVPVNFDLQAQMAKQQAAQKAAETGQMTEEMKRDMSPEQKAAMDKALKERSAAMAKNKALNDAFNGGMEAMKGGQWDTAIEQFSKASEMDPKQHVIWAQLADSYNGLAKSKTGAESDAASLKAIEAYGKAIELKPDDASYINNNALTLARVKKYAEAQTELEKAAALNPAGAGQYFFNLGAIYTNTGQYEPAANAFKRAMEAQPPYPEAFYQYAMSITSKATVKADGTTVYPDEMKVALQKYLELNPTGGNADAAKSFLEAMGAKVDTTYSNPAAKKKGAAPAPAPVKKK